MVKLVVLLKMCLFAWDIEVFWILMHCSNSEHSRKMGFLVKICLFSCDTEVCFCGNCLLLGKMMAFFCFP